MTQSLFVTLTDTCSNRQLRIHTAHIVGYGKEVLHSTGETVTVVYTTNPDIGAIFVKQTPEQLDSYLSECYITIKGEQ